MSIRVESRTYYSLQHIKSAALFSRLSAENQKLYDTGDFLEVQNKNDAYVTGCIFSSVAFLEGIINELFEDMTKRESESILHREIGALSAEIMAKAVDNTGGNITVHELEVLLAGKFELNPKFKSNANSFFPHKCLGHGCAQWAVRS